MRAEHTTHTYKANLKLRLKPVSFIGTCHCGSCMCDNKDNRGLVTGRFCECDDSECLDEDTGEVCGGMPGHLHSRPTPKTDHSLTYGYSRTTHPCHSVLTDLLHYVLAAVKPTAVVFYLNDILKEKLPQFVDLLSENLRTLMT